MATSPFVFDATADNFRTLVLGNSEKGPVLANYWSPRAGPCLMLMPRLVRLATEFRGRFLLVMINTDELSQLAREHGVTSIPTVKVYRHSKIVDTLHGAESESVLRKFIVKHVEKEAETKYAAAIQAYQRGDLDNAVTQAAQATLAEPDNPRLAIDLVKLLMLQKRYLQADDLMKSLPAIAHELPEVRDLAVHVNLIRVAQEAPPVSTLEKKLADSPDDLEARYCLAAVKMNQDEYEEAMKQFLEIIRRDRENQKGRHGLLAIFAMLGENHALVLRYRTQLNKINN